METTLAAIIDDLKGYRTFNDRIDIRFVCALLEAYLPSEKLQITKSFDAGKLNAKTHIDSKFEDSQDYFQKTFSTPVKNRAVNKNKF
jgi:hypothetical protein